MSIVSFALIAALIVPQTNERTLDCVGLAEANLAYSENGDGTASLYVGNELKTALPVESPHGLRSYGVRELEYGEYVITHTSGITFDGTNRYFVTSMNTPERIVITCKPGINVSGYNLKFNDDYSGMDPSPTAEYTETMTNNVIFVAVKKLKSCNAWIEYDGVYTMRHGSMEAVNDITKNVYIMKDSLGQYDLGKWREWGKNLYNGNRGNDWSKYNATNNVHLMGYSVSFDAKNRYGIQIDAQTNFVMRAGSHTPIKVYASGASGGGAGYDGDFEITAFAKTNTTVYIKYETDILGFNTAAVQIQTADTIKQEFWDIIPNTSYTITSDTIVIPNQVAGQSGQRFYKLVYNGITLDQIKIEFTAPVYILNDLYLKGEDNIVYKISVNGGVISATAVQ